jgi:hypothetical protein
LKPDDAVLVVAQGNDDRVIPTHVKSTILVLPEAGNAQDGIAQTFSGLGVNQRPKHAAGGDVALAEFLLGVSEQFLHGYAQVPSLLDDARHERPQHGDDHLRDATLLLVRPSRPRPVAVPIDLLVREPAFGLQVVSMCVREPESPDESAVRAIEIVGRGAVMGVPAPEFGGAGLGVYLGG